MGQSTSTQCSPFSAQSAWFPAKLPSGPLFGTDGIRGQVGQLLNAPFAMQLGFWAGRVLQAHAVQPKPVIVGQDSRNSSDMLSAALAAGLSAAGIEVWSLGICPTPTVAYLARTCDTLGGVMISASHNPPEDNGIKFFGADGTKLASHLQQQIESCLRGIFRRDTPAQSFVTSCQWGKQYVRTDLLNDYVHSLLLPLQQTDLSGLRIVLDLAWGAAFHLAPWVFQEKGAELICLHDRPDGDRINVSCGSTNLSPLQQAVKQHRADIGFAFDGDADRVIAVDAKGRVIDGDYILYFWGKQLYQLQQLPNHLIVSTVMANLAFEQAWEQLGGQLIRTAVGDQYVQTEMARSGAALGGEQSGHILCRHYGSSGDGLLTALHLASLTQHMNLSLADLRDQSFQPYPQLLRNIRVENRDRRLNWEQCDPLQNRIEQAQLALGKQGRILVRASGTEPVIRVMVEAAQAELADQWADTLVLAAQQYLND